MTILCYHAVRDDWDSVLAVRVAEFEAHCRHLAARRTVVDLETAVRRLDGSGRLPRGQTAITFDDGFSDFATHAAPVLHRHGLPATMFLVAETLTAAGRPVDWVVPKPSVALTTLSVTEVLDLRDRGVTFGSHSYSHHDLDTLDAAECEHDLRTSREVLEDVLGQPVTLLAYPRGRHNRLVRAAASRAGYRFAFTLPEAPERASAHAVPRVGVYRDNTVTTLRVKGSRWYLPTRTSRAFGALQTGRRALRRPRAG